jgi:peroxiredoxin
MIEVYNAMKEKDVQFLGISADTGPSAKEDVQNFINEYKIPYAVIIDRDEALQQAFGNIRAYPTTFILGKDGTVLSQWVGLRDKEFFTTELQKYLQ